MEDSNSKKTNLTFSVDNILSNNFKRKSELDLEVEHKIKQPPLKSLKEDTMKVTNEEPLSAVSDITNENDDSSSDLDDTTGIKSSPGFFVGKNGTTVELLGQDLWKKFHKLGTEMIITKAGSSKWMVAGAGDPLPSSSLFLHGDSPALGEMWTTQGSVIFDKLKVTNNRCTIIQGQICLHSMHKYLPKVFVIPMNSDQTNMNQESLLRYFEEHGIPDYAEEFSFPETTFITVTAYQNQQITKLKIDSNPFAKGFREATRTREPQHLQVSNDNPYLHHLTMEALFHRQNPFQLMPTFMPNPLWITPIIEHPHEDHY